ncbi:hypothetical protein [Gandjariella thermophila]|uniref:SAV-6107-like HEPN domain-containing protein n=1 Tax=Gandjariella thermophila TaxID=1931992 RepID=A0A4D4J7K6_9PSEU|nr:hypothetical protein [Gandjariella thermophila]GDY29937.1 hypothetical protein GTS_15700 [Gandjariella thermophila]
MPYQAQGPTFLPLTVAAARAAAIDRCAPAERGSADIVQRRAEAAEATAAACWTALLAGCDSPARRALPARLRELTEATSSYAGIGSGSVHCRRVTQAQVRIDEAVRDGDGEEFAEAFVGYDQAVATAVVCGQGRMGSPTS